MKTKILRILQIILGLVFIFSGFVKAIDPLGTVYKMLDYFGVLGLKALSPAAGLFSVLLIAFEFVTGCMLLLNLFPKIALIFATLLMAAFTPLTLYLAIANPISDCGCFGDAVKMTNWQTFWKNIIFDLLIIGLWLGWKNLNNSRLSVKKQFIIVCISLLLILGFQAYNLMYLPIMDFRPYKIGVNITEELQKHPKAEFETILIYRNKKTGQLQEFTEDNYPWDDTINWEWVDTKVREIKVSQPTEGIHDFYFTTLDGQDITDSILQIAKPVMIIIAPELNKANIKGFKRIVQYFNHNKDNYFPVLFCATASTLPEINKFRTNNDFDQVVFLTSDGTTLKTIVRANPGIIVLKQGTIIDKKAWRQVGKK